MNHGRLCNFIQFFYKSKSEIVLKQSFLVVLFTENKVVSTFKEHIRYKNAQHCLFCKSFFQAKKYTVRAKSFLLGRPDPARGIYVSYL